MVGVTLCGSRLGDLDIGRASLRVASAGSAAVVDFDSQLTDREATRAPVRFRGAFLLEWRGAANMTMTTKN